MSTNQFIQFLQQGIASIIRFFEMVWKWSFGEVFAMYQKNLPLFGTLPIWKQVLMVVVALAVAYILFRVFRELLEAVISIFSGFATLLRAIITNIIPLLVAGAIAFSGSWVVNNMNVAWLP